MKYVTAYVKPTNFCNVGCEHCYLSQETRADKSRMSWETLGSVATTLEEMRKARGADATMAIWHGGEPLVLPAEWFWLAGETLAAKGTFVESLQTSLIPLRADHMEWIMARLGGRIGSSVDFSSRGIRGSNESYLSLWMKKVDMAREAGCHVTPGMVPARGDLGREAWILSWLVSNEFDRFNIERHNSYGFTAPGRPSNMEHSVFLRNISEPVLDMFERTGSAPKIRVVAAGINGVLRGLPGDRWGGSCQSDFVVFEPDGSTNTCPDKAGREPAMSMAADGYRALESSGGRRKWMRIQAVGHYGGHCHGCENVGWCKSGCPIAPNDPEREGGECSGHRTYLSWLSGLAKDEGKKDILEGYANFCMGN